MVSLSKQIKQYYKKKYALWFFALILPMFLISAASFAGNLLLTSNLLTFLLLSSKLALAVVTTHYAIKLNTPDIWAIILGLSTVLPVMPWVALLIVLTR